MRRADCHDSNLSISRAFKNADIVFKFLPLGQSAWADF